MRYTWTLVLTIMCFAASAQWRPVQPYNMRYYGLRADSAVIDGPIKSQASNYSTGGYTGLVRNATSGRYETVDYPFVFPEDYGAAGDGVTNDASALQAALNSGKPVMLRPKKYYVASPINITLRTRLTGAGDSSVVYTDQNSAIINIQSKGVTIDNIRLEGNGRGTATPYQTTRGSQYGIRLVGNSGLTTDWSETMIYNVKFYMLGGAGLYVKDHLGEFNLYEGGIKAVNCFAEQCYVGYYFDVRGEYNALTSCHVVSCEYGYTLHGGNNLVTSAIINRNRVGVFLGTGTNNGHAKLVGCSINHNIAYGIQSLGTSLGYLFSGCNIEVNKVYLENSICIRFVGCDFYADTIFAKNITQSQFAACRFRNAPKLMLNWDGTTNAGAASDIVWVANKWQLGQPTEITNNTLEGDLRLTGSFATTPKVVTGNYTMGAMDYNLAVNNSANQITTLPAISSCSGREYTVVKKSGNAFTVTVQGNGSELVNGSNTSVISAQWGSVTIWNDGTQWIIKSKQ